MEEIALESIHANLILRIRAFSLRQLDFGKSTNKERELKQKRPYRQRKRYKCAYLHR